MSSALILSEFSNTSFATPTQVSTSTFSQEKEVPQLSNQEGHTSATNVAQRQRSDITKVLLLNGYPILYVILWTPGLLSRLIEAIGTTPRWLMLLQVSPQFIGLANAITYGYNENVKRQIKQSWANSRARRSQK